ncbi:tRNA (adenosine(37)-N6)-threonylcarbamoyltransferase complex ATPase subunit type 1 TsaE [Prochlorococcus marinus]|uniref:tRNA (adenosine(37)-N6)-threonylcarbamoyltransferase complex ATPase subunit type 1 TsaE n=1 Tax=Prochlorococcus marinus TaxID=1219 RepID=UPI0022B35B51|nr:tRNA (adenosine(37)-N6)-threonylcarbamoyltransferase complex ATPase subunit type 1 TsaE [Prochlorococcus marinus]
MQKKIQVPNQISDNSNQSSWFLENHDATIKFGESFVHNLKDIQILLLDGPLGAGKTSLVKGLAKGLAIQEPITSPTFALAHHYLNGKRALIHLDLYRLDNPMAADELFLQEEETTNQLGGLMVIEWPSKLSLKINDSYLIQIRYLSNGGRQINLITAQPNDKNFSTSG